MKLLAEDLRFRRTCRLLQQDAYHAKMTHHDGTHVTLGRAMVEGLGEKFTLIMKCDMLVVLLAQPKLLAVHVGKRREPQLTRTSEASSRLSGTPLDYQRFTYLRLLS